MKRLVITLVLLLTAAVCSFAQTGTWSGKLDVQGAQLSLVFHLDGEKPTMDSPDQGAKGIPIQVTRTATGGITIQVPSIGATYEGLWMIKRIVGTFKQMGASFPLTLVPGEAKLRRPQTPEGPFPYTQEEVAFHNGDAVLKGTLVLPEGCSRKTPVLIMVTGSGLQNRDEEIFEHKPFAVIADALARAGIGLLRERFDHVGVLGHSEGGTIALLLAAEKKVDFTVSLAGMAVSGKETLLWQNHLALAATGIPTETVDVYCKALGDVFNAKIAGEPMPSASQYDLPAALAQNLAAVAMQLQTPYLNHFLTVDTRPLLGSITCPVLALNGALDRQVDPESNLGALRSGLPNHPKNRVEGIDGVNHLFQHCQTGLSNEYRTIEETIAPEVLEIIVKWLTALQ